MSRSIKFTDIVGVEKEFYPKPAVAHIPEWYKLTEEYVGGKKEVPPEGNGVVQTVKKCIPVFDAITAGYIITSPADVYVSQQDGKPYYSWSNLGLIEFHPITQAPLHPSQNGAPYPKWNNPWAIKTEPGYSCLFVQPFHRESVFTILPGVVDTDSYFSSVNFPFVLNDVKFEGMIPAGTPIAQVIPFKRDSFKMEIGSEKDFKEQALVVRKLKTTFFNSYKLKFWHRKEYK